MFKKINSFKPSFLIVISIFTVIAALYAEHCSVKCYRLTGNIEGIHNIESGLRDYLLASRERADLKMIALYKVREGLTMINVMSKNHSVIEHLFQHKFPIANPNNNIHEELYASNKLNLKDMMMVLKQTQKVSYEKRALALLESLEKVEK